MKFTRTLAACALALLSLAARAHDGQEHARKAGPPTMEQKPWGIAAEARAARRTIELDMTDNMRFTPDRVEIRQGEVVRFVVRNRGKILHEIVIGTRKDLQEHAALMASFPDMEHSEAHMAHVRPGAAGQLVWRFNRAGEFDFACLIAGHYQAGMTGKIVVVRN